MCFPSTILVYFFKTFVSFQYTWTQWYWFIREGKIRWFIRFSYWHNYDLLPVIWDFYSLPKFIEKWQEYPFGSLWKVIYLRVGVELLIFFSTTRIFFRFSASCDKGSCSFAVNGTRTCTWSLSGSNELLFLIDLDLFHICFTIDKLS